jgi:hypothetical protein
MRSTEAAAGVCPEGSFASSEDHADHLGVLDVERALRGAFPRSCIGLYEAFTLYRRAFQPHSTNATIGNFPARP